MTSTTNPLLNLSFTYDELNRLLNVSGGQSQTLAIMPSQLDGHILPMGQPFQATINFFRMGNSSIMISLGIKMATL